MIGLCSFVGAKKCMFNESVNSENTLITLKELTKFPVSLTLKREDLLHPMVSGNKFRKLKYNISEAKIKGASALLTFGGAFSNHIAATAIVGKLMRIRTIGVIRGEELAENYHNNTTLAGAEKNGMILHFVSRSDYANKDSEEFLERLEDIYGSFYLLPEGGTNALAVKGCSEILTPKDSSFDYIATSVGTGGTLAGLVNGSDKHQIVIGYSALKGTFQNKVVQKYTSKTNYSLTDVYCFGGYAKIDSALIRFMNNFKQQTGILLDPVYTGKLMYGIVEDIKSGQYPKNSRILAIHTGGLQGIPPMNRLLENKNLPQIEF